MRREQFSFLILGLVMLAGFMMVLLKPAVSPEKDTAFIVFSDDGSAVKSFPQVVLSYETATLPLSVFSKIEFLTLKEIDKRLDPLDPRRTPFLTALIGFFKPHTEDSNITLLPNRYTYRKFLRTHGMSYSILGKRDNAPSITMKALYYLFVIIIILIISFLRIEKTVCFFLLMPWSWIVFAESWGLSFIVMTLNIVLLQIVLYRVYKKSTDIMFGVRHVVLLGASIIAMTVSLRVCGHGYPAVLHAAHVLTVPAAIVLDDRLAVLLNKRWIHPRFRAVAIIPRSPKIHIQDIVVSLCAIGMLYLLPYIPQHTGHVLSELDAADSRNNISINDFYANAAFQAGYLHKTAYQKPEPNARIHMTTYIKEKDRFKTGQITVKEFTDEWYRDIIAETHPLLLKFCVTELKNTEYEGLYDMGNVYLLILPLLAVLLLRIAGGWYLRKQSFFPV